jgi:hypothetical protein
MMAGLLTTIALENRIVSGCSRGRVTPHCYGPWAIDSKSKPCIVNNNLGELGE